jgi:DNA repair protein RecO (recombination protein O)
MPLERATGLVLRTRPLTESSLIVHWLTPDLGRLATVAKGARQPKSPFRGKLDLFYEADFAFQRSRRSPLHTLREVALRDPHAALRADLARLRQATYAALLVEQVSEEETPLPEQFALLTELLAALVEHPAQPAVTFAFELKLLATLGLAPDLAQSQLNANARAFATRLANERLIAVARLAAGPAELNDLRQFLHGFILFHLGRIPPSRGQ